MEKHGWVLDYCELTFTDLDNPSISWTERKSPGYTPCAWSTDYKIKVVNYYKCGGEQCEAHDHKACYNNDVYWYDSCNRREDKWRECGDGRCVESGNDAYCENNPPECVNFKYKCNDDGYSYSWCIDGHWETIGSCKDLPYPAKCTVKDNGDTIYCDPTGVCEGKYLPCDYINGEHACFANKDASEHPYSHWECVETPDKCGTWKFVEDCDVCEVIGGEETGRSVRCTKNADVMPMVWGALFAALVFFTKYKRRKDIGKAAVLAIMTFLVAKWAVEHILAVGIVGLIAAGLIWYFFGGLIVLIIANKILK